MVSKIFSIINKEVRGLHEAAYLLAIFTILSQVLGIFRDRLLASMFGAGEMLDVYYAAFRIPDVIFVTVSSLVSVSVLIPFLVHKVEKSKEEAREFINAIFTVFFGLIIIVASIAFVFVPLILSNIVPNLMEGRYAHELISLTRILLLSPILLGFSNLCGSVTQSYKKFITYAISPVLYNFGIILGIVFLYPYFGVVGLAYGVVLGALFHLLIQLPVLLDNGLFPKFHIGKSFSNIKDVFLLSFPRTFTLGVSQISLIVLIGLASYMAKGSISIFNFAFNLQSVPMSIIGVSYSLAAFPTLSRLYSRGEFDKFLQHLVTAARHIIFWSIPITVLFIVLRAQIVRTILGAGAFSWADTRLTAAALALFSFSVISQSLILLFVRGYYSAGETKKPLIINTISSICIIVFAYTFVWIFDAYPFFRYVIESMFRVEDIPGTEMLSLPLAYSVATIINGVLLWISFEYKFKNFSRTLWKPLFDSLSASLIMGFISYQVLNIFGNIFDLTRVYGVFLQGFCAGIVGIISAIIVLKLLKNQEIEIVWKTLHKKVWKAKIVIPEQTEIEV